MLLQIQKASGGLLRRFHHFTWRRRIQHTPTSSTSPSASSSLSSSSSSSSSFTFHAYGKRRPFHCDSFGAPSSKKHDSYIFSLAYLGSAAFIFVLKNKAVSAAEDSAADPVPQNDNVVVHLSNLSRIEDGSIVSNAHTVKWRIFTDNARSLFLKGNLDEAEKFFILALQEAKDGFGDGDAHVASSLNNLAELYRIKKELEKAEPLYLNAIEILEESFGHEDVRIGAAFHNLGQFYIVQRKLEKALNCYERALKIKGRVLGHGHPDYAETMYHIGMVLHLMGKNEDSKALVEDSIRILEDGGLGESMACIRRMKRLAQILRDLNQLKEAENLQRKILHILELSKVGNYPRTTIPLQESFDESSSNIFL